MHNTVGNFVHAQVSINRAVFEANKPKADEAYLSRCASEAIEELALALKFLTRRGKRK